MRRIDDIMLSRRQALALGGAGSLALTLAACGGQQDEAPAPDAEPEAPTPEPEETEEPEPTPLDAAAYDALVAAGPVADDATIAASTWATKVKDAGTLRVGGTQTSTLFSLLNEVDNKTRGFDAGLYQMLARYITGSEENYEITLVQSSTRESVLQSDQVDAVFATYSITPEREQLISFAGPYFTAHQGILVTADNTDINSEDDLAGKTVGVQEGSTGRAILEEYVPEATVQELGTDEELRRALEQGRIDAYVTDSSLHMGSIVANPGKYRLAGEFGPEDPYGIGLPLDSDGVAFVNDFLQAIEVDGTWAELWQVAIGDRIGVSDVPNPPEIAV